MLRYVLQHPGRAVSALTTDPRAVWDKIRDSLAQRREYGQQAVHRHTAMADWERRLHQCIGAGACAASGEFTSLWQQAIADVRRAGIDVGPASFSGYNDGDTALVRAIWCLVRHLKSQTIVETGVGHGFTSRMILEALALNGGGHLSSIDRPPLDPVMRARVGIAVGARFPEQWTLIADSSRRALPPLLKTLGGIDLFVHDSQHTERNVRFELDRAWAVLKPGGAIVVDDIDSNGGFSAFSRTASGFTALVCEAEPVRPDERRFNGKGLFGIILKDAA